MIVMTPTHKKIVDQLEKSRDFAKHVLNVSNIHGSALISHKFRVSTFVSDRVEMITEIDFLPIVRLYKSGQNTIVDDEDLLNEDVEDVSN